MTDWQSRPRLDGVTRWSFPPPDAWPDNDIIAMGGDLEPATVISAYRNGIFPMVVETAEPVLAWWSPEARGILPLDALRVTRSLRQSARRYDVRVDTAFGDVIRACANPSRDRAWITSEFIDAYTTLHELGWAHASKCSIARGSSPAACTAYASTAYLQASRCFICSATRQRSR